jgi:hypothetical protein
MEDMDIQGERMTLLLSLQVPKSSRIVEEDIFCLSNNKVYYYPHYIALQTSSVWLSYELFRL